VARICRYDFKDYTYAEYQYLITGDTVVNGITYHHLTQKGYSRIVTPSGSQVTPIDFCMGYFRNDSLEKKVWHTGNFNLSERLLYDFNLQLGDSLIIEDDFYGDYIGIISNIDTLLLADDSHKRFTVFWERRPHDYPYEYSYIIEGIGSTMGLFSFLYEKESPIYSPFYAMLRCFTVNEDPIYIEPTGWGDCTPLNTIEDYYQNKTMITVYPNPVSHEFQIQSDLSNLDEVFIYTIQGQCVSHIKLQCKSQKINITTLQAGVYLLKVKDTQGNIYTTKIIKM